MEYEWGTDWPEGFRETWPGEFAIFSRFEFACGIPQAVFAITTLKEGGAPNVCPHSWSCFQGEGGGYFAVLPGLLQRTHTLANIRRTGEFCINFLAPRWFGGLMATIRHNEDAVDEFAAGGFTPEPAKTIAAPRIAESFLCLECRLEREEDLTGTGLYAMVVGRVLHMAARAEYGRGVDAKYGPEGFFFNIHSPRDLCTGTATPMALGTLRVEPIPETGD